MRKYLLLGLLVALAAGCGGDNPQPLPAGGNQAGDQGEGEGDGGGPTIIPPPARPKVLIEGESAGKLVQPFATGAHAKASGGRYLTLPSAGCDGRFHKHIAPEDDPKRKAGSAELEFTVERQAEYVLWVRKWSCCSCGDSWRMQFDEGKPFDFGNAGTNHGFWSWLAQQDADGKVRFKLSPGKHKLKLTNRGESGFRIDQVLLWADHKQVPQGIEKPQPAVKEPTPGRR